MRKISFLLFLVLFAANAYSQQNVIDSLRQVFAKTENDSLTFCSAIQLGELYTFNNADSSIYFIRKAANLAQDKENALWKAHSYYAMSLYFYIGGDFASALYFSFKNINEFEQHQDPNILTLSSHMVLSAYEDEKAIAYASNTLSLLDTLEYVNNMHHIHFLNSKGKTFIATYMRLANTYIKLNKIDSALIYGQKGYQVNQDEQINWNFPLIQLAIVYEKLGRINDALTLYRNALPMAFRENIMVDVVKNYLGRAQLFKRTSRFDSTIFYAKKALDFEKGINYKQGTLEAGLLLSDSYEKQHMNDSAFHYYKFAMDTKDSLFSEEKIKQMQSIGFKEELRERERQQLMLINQAEYRNKIKIYIVLGVAVVFLIIALILWKFNKQKQKANVLLYQKNKQIETTLTELKSAQAKLIQSEKMASLGELTAGIAHEIQNPLNFVNNFSELNRELIEDLKTEKAKGKNEKDEGLENQLLDNIAANEEKINHHGKRADAIVKSMLQHSQASSGKKVPTDINALCEEYLRLASHVLKAKDKSFNAEYKTDFDRSIGKIEIASQDIGRAIFNIINNALYAVNDKAKNSSQDYEPIVTVSTKSANGNIKVIIKDNGNGIPEAIREKIFQPFFTTKPTGQGTGLGLSLSYDIIKAHGGEITVESAEGIGTNFKIKLPVNA